MVLVATRNLAATDRAPVVDARVVFLTHYIPLYQVRVLQSIAASVRDFHVLLSTPIEPNRNFDPDWSGLDVTVQDTWTVRNRWKHRAEVGFDDQLYVHIPYDTSSRLKALKPDVVMSLELGARSMGAIRYCQKHPESRSLLCTYMSEHTEKNRGWLRRQLRSRLVRRADGLTYNGPSCKDYLNSLGVSDDRLHHFPYAADDRTVYTGPVARDEESVRGNLLCVGQLSQRKGVVLMLNQLAKYCRSNPNRQMVVRFAGAGPAKDALAAIEVPSNLQVRFLGNIAPDELAVEMLSSGALIAPTLADEWLLVVNEALQAGLPVIGSIYAQAVTTLVQENGNGWTYDPANESSLHAALNKYYDVPSEQIAAMRPAARKSVVNRTPGWAATGAVSAIRSVMGIGDGSLESPCDELAPAIGHVNPTTTSSS